MVTTVIFAIAMAGVVAFIAYWARREGPDFPEHTPNLELIQAKVRAGEAADFVAWEAELEQADQ